VRRLWSRRSTNARARTRGSAGTVPQARRSGIPVLARTFIGPSRVFDDLDVSCAASLEFASGDPGFAGGDIAERTRRTNCPGRATVAAKQSTRVLVDAVHAHLRHHPRPVVGLAVLTAPAVAAASAGPCSTNFSCTWG